MIHGFGPKETGVEQKCFAAILPLILSLTSDPVNPATLQYPQHRQEKLQLVAAMTPIPTGMIALVMWMAETRFYSTWLQTIWK